MSKAPTKDTGWGPMEVHFEAAREAARALKDAGFDIELHEPNLPIYAPADEGKRLARKGKDEDEVFEWRGDPYIQIADRGKLVEVCRFLRDELSFDQIIDVSAVDFDAEEEHLWGVYLLLSIPKKARLNLKVFIPKNEEDCQVESITSIHPGADWHERESGEMYGITYVGHPDPRNILLPDDWVGYPLRKDYEFPEEYHGISCV